MDGITEEQRSALSCLKVLVLGFNVIFMMTGIMMVSIGTTIFGVYYYFNEFLETQFFSPASLLIITGSFIFLIAVIGFISVVKESTLMINTYCLLLCFVAVLLLSAGISSVILKGRVSETLKTKMNETIMDYPYDCLAAASMDSIQKTLQCCGIYDPYDWKDIFPMDGRKYMFNDLVLPDSCCREFDFGSNVCLRTYIAGCLPQLRSIIFQTLRIAFGTSLTLAILQLVGISFTHKLAKELIKLKSERLARQIVLANQMQNVYDAMGVNGNRGAYAFADKPPSYDEVTRPCK